MSNNSFKAHIPNAITCANLLCGCLGIIACLSENQLLLGAILILWAAIFDFFDGCVARFLHVSGELGKQLDSLADVVSFGVLPAMIMFRLMSPLDSKLAYVAMLIPIFSALRLAKFNIDPRQSEGFIGVPTPANAMLIASFPFIQAYNPTLAAAFDNLWLLMGVCVVMSLLLVSELPLLALKFKTFDFAENRYKYILIGVSVILLIIFQFVAIPFIVLLYILLSLIKKILNQ